jgi:hypothetical protein
MESCGFMRLGFEGVMTPGAWENPVRFRGSEQIMKRRVASDRQEFNVTWRMGWYRLAHLSEHLREGVNPTGSEYLLYDSTCRAIRAPKAEVFIPSHPGQTDATA